MGDLTTARVEFNLEVNPDDLVTAFGGDDNRIFLFIMELLEHESVGIEVRERLLEELQTPTAVVSGDDT